MQFTFQSALLVHSQAGPCTSGDPILLLGLGTARHKPSQTSPVLFSPVQHATGNQACRLSLCVQQTTAFLSIWHHLTALTRCHSCRGILLYDPATPISTLLALMADQTVISSTHVTPRAWGPSSEPEVVFQPSSTVLIGL